MIQELILNLKRNNIIIDVVDDNLKISGNKSYLTPDIVESIRKNKSEIISFLNNTNLSGHSIDIYHAPEGSVHEVSRSQRRIWMIQSFNKNLSAYNLPFAFSIHGNLNVKYLQQSLLDLIRKYEILRTAFVNIDGEIKQVIEDPDNLKCEIRIIECTHHTIKEYIDKELDFVFDLEKLPLFYFNLYKITEEEYVLFSNFHHIISDGWSMGLLVKELITGYNSFLAYQTIAQSPLNIQYKDYSYWHNKEFSRQKLSSERKYWLTQFESIPEPFELFLDFPRSNKKGYLGKRHQYTLESNIYKSLQLYSATHSSSLFNSILTCVFIALKKYSASEDIVIGIPVAGRDNSTLHNQIGCFVNTLAIRSKVVNSCTINELAKSVKTNLINALANSQYPFDSLVEDLGINTPSRNPLFDVMVAFQDHSFFNFNQIAIEDNVQLKEYPLHAKYSKFDLFFEFIDRKDSLTLNIEYNPDLISSARIDQLGAFLHYLLENVNQLAQKSIVEIPYSSNFTYVQPVYSESVHALKRINETNYSHTDICYKGNSLSWTNFLKEVEKFGSYFKAQSLKEGDRLGILMDRSLEMLVSIYACLDAGLCYIPINPDYPTERINSIIKDSALKFILTDQVLIKEEFQDITVLEVKNYAEYPISEEGKCLNLNPKFSYILYTSGSSGIPKGVQISFDALLNNLNSLQTILPFQQGDRWLLKTPATFDVSMPEIFICGLYGTNLSILESGEEKNPQSIIDLIYQDQITHISFVPSMFSLFQLYLNDDNLKKIQSLKYIFLAGEALPANLVNDFNLLKTGINLINLYGPTEATIYATYYNLSDWNGKGIIPIGKPLPNYEVCILDSDLNMLPPLIPGDIYIGGPSLSSGYINNEELTRQKFIPHPQKNGERLYKSGDKGVLLPDGNIEFLGRQDDQIKLRGFRIEIGEIENVVYKYKNIKEVAVILDDKNNDNQQLIAFCTCEITPQNVDDLIGHTKHYLPGYMVPSEFVFLEEMPRNASEKIDKKKLKELDYKSLLNKKEFNSIANSETEDKLLLILSEVLKKDKNQLNTQDELFRLGLSSLSLIKLKFQVASQFGIDFSLEKLYDNISIHDLALLIDEVNNEEKLMANDREYFSV